MGPGSDNNVNSEWKGRCRCQSTPELEGGVGGEGYVILCVTKIFFFMMQSVYNGI